MPSTYTDNLNLEKQAAGENVDLWGDPHLNQNVIAPLDAASGGVTSIALTSSNYSMSSTEWRCRTIKLTGTLSASVNVIFPLNPNSATVAVGGDRIIDNQCTGNYTVTVKTAASGSTGVVVPQGVRSLVVSDTANVTFDDDRLGNTDVSRIPTVSGSPNGSTTGYAGSAYKPAALVFDRTNKIVYASTADSTSGWVPQSGYFPFPQGYLTPVSGTAIITTTSTSATAVYYTPYVGNTVPIYDGNWLQAYFFSELTLTLTSSNAANQIYDVFAFLDSGTVTIGTGPAWATPTAGAGARGTGAGTTQLARINGLWTNAVSMSARNGASTYSVAVGQGTYLGSIYIDGTNGQVSCYRSWGQSRKWGIWNCYNRANTVLVVGDSTSTWTYSSATVRPSNNSSANSLTTFTGLAEEIVDITFLQKFSVSGGSPFIGIGYNSTAATSGTQATSNTGAESVTAAYTAPPALGINTVTCLESGLTADFKGTQTNMLLTARWRV